jgi:hypothetical protein
MRAWPLQATPGVAIDTLPGVDWLKDMRITFGQLPSGDYWIAVKLTAPESQ